MHNTADIQEIKRCSQLVQVGWLGDQCPLSAQKQAISRTRYWVEI